MASDTTSTSAAERVLLLPELLEQILLFLTFKELYRARRVCKTWDNAIEASPVLKTAMFLTATDKDDASERDFNPILEADLIPKLLKSGPVDVSDPTIPAWERPDASWRKMLVANQPNRFVRVKLVKEHGDSAMHRRIETDWVTCWECTLGEAWDAAKKETVRVQSFFASHARNVYIITGGFAVYGDDDDDDDDELKVMRLW
jgi:hypothetical protein